MHGWDWLERPTAGLSFDWEIADEQMVHEAISQASEYFNFECHDNIQKQHGEKNWSAVIQNSVNWRTVCEVCKCAGTQSARPTFFRQHSAATNRKTFYKQASTFWEESNTTEMCGKRKDCVLVWCVWHWTLRGMFPSLPHQAQILK
jgi:hypothetical protein